MDKTLFLGASHSESTIINVAHDLGIDFATLGLKRSVDVPARNHSYYDYSNTEIVKRMAYKLGITKIVAGCNDFAAITASTVAMELGLQAEVSQEVALKTHNKDIWIEEMQSIEISVPQTIVIDESTNLDLLLRGIEWESKKFLVKPVDVTGGKGLVYTTRDSFHNSIRESLLHSRKRRCLLQEAIEGHLYSVFTVSVNGEYKFYFAEEDVDENYRVKYAIMPAVIPEQARRAIEEDIKKYLIMLGINRGFMHAQFILTDKNHYIIDICTRPPGDLYFRLLRHSYGFNFENFLLIAPEKRLIDQSSISLSTTIRYVVDPEKDPTSINLENVIEEYVVRNQNGPIQDPQFEGKILFLKFADITQARDFLSRSL